MYDCVPIVLTRDKTKEGVEHSNTTTGSLQFNISVRCLIFIVYHEKLGWLASHLQTILQIQFRALYPQTLDLTRVDSTEK